MKLTAEQLISVLQAMESQNRGVPKSEKRTTARIGARYSVRVRPIIGKSAKLGVSTTAWIRDVSGGGVGLACPLRMQQDEAFVIELPRVDNSSLDVMCMVTRCASAGPGVFHIGARFLVQWYDKEEKAVKQSNSKRRAAVE